MATNTPRNKASASQHSENVALAPPEITSAPPSSDSHDQQVDELKELTRSLMGAVQAMQAQSARNAIFNESIRDVRSATRSLLAAPVGIADRESTSVIPLAPPAPAPGSCDCPPCECVSEHCCTFDITMTRVRVLHMQLPIEVLDSNITPFGMMEVRMFASVDGIGAMIPDLFGYLSLHKLINQAGVWSQVNRSIGTVQVTKGKPKTIALTVDAMEVETASERIKPANRDEYGTGAGSMTLDCCCDTKTPLTIDVSFTGGGQGAGEISVQFVASKKC